MRAKSATLAALALTLAAYAGIAWAAGRIDIPPAVPTARLAWYSPFRVVATIGFAIASSLGLRHIAGDFLAAMLLGGLLGGVFALSRRLMAG
jgi:MFS-type transporter involved in bile tolerance (Atg22 family)